MTHYLPERKFEEPLTIGPAKGTVLSKEDFEKELDEYYELRGWDKTTGRPTKAKLEELGLADVAETLIKLGLIQ
ncbi:MAG: hypothetical protein DRJ39_04675 [Thermoprotei archaeon]|nr:hypothetical protein [Thermoproteales archaeon]RLE83568.1 MAG: hypothetical protein DRJ39_04675 [Thermoprotei archaeon]